jgi:hypothetical protein
MLLEESDMFNLIVVKQKLDPNEESETSFDSE